MSILPVSYLYMAKLSEDHTSASYCIGNFIIFHLIFFAQAKKFSHIF